MSSKILTYFFGFDYTEITLIWVTGTTLEAIAEELTPLLLPDKVQFRKRIKSVVFIHQTAPRHDIFRPITLYPIDIHYVYSVESVLFETDLLKLVTRYDIDMRIAGFSFMTGLTLILLSTLFLLHEIAHFQWKIYNFFQEFYFVIPVLIIIKFIIAYHIHTDIEAYREKLRRL